jgi:hypothetical protein
LLLKKFSASQRFISVIWMSSPDHILNKWSPVSTHTHTHFRNLFWDMTLLHNGSLVPDILKDQIPSSAKVQISGISALTVRHTAEKWILQPHNCGKLKIRLRIHLFKVHLISFPQTRLSLPKIPNLLSCTTYRDTVILNPLILQRRWGLLFHYYQVRSFFFFNFSNL